MDSRTERKKSGRRVAERPASRGNGRKTAVDTVGLEYLCEYLESAGFGDRLPRLAKGGSESRTEVGRKIAWAIASTYNCRVEGTIEEIADGLATAIHQVWATGLL